MTELEFHISRVPLYLDSTTSLVVFPDEEHMNSSHADWFSDIGIPITNTVRGYYYTTKNFGEYIMLYCNDFEIPDIDIKVITSIFNFFPNLQWIGLGCHKGEIGEIWNPKLLVTKNL